jgi:hypothetical protein
MRDFTNLAWPEGPFGADQRPFGRRERILMALALDLDERAGLVSAATVYCRTHRTRVVEVRADTLNVGFRVTVAEAPGDEIGLLDIVDRALVRGRRHAVVLAGHGLGRDLAWLRTPDDRRRPGVSGVADAWAGRRVAQRGIAVMVDTEDDVEDGDARVDVALTPARWEACGGQPDVLAASSLVRCIAIALVAARHIGVYEWDGRFAVRQAAEMAAWDQMDGVEWASLPLQSADRTRAGGSA